MHKVSVIVRTKNEEDWIGLCVKAIAEQKTDREVEIVLVDNNSTDKTVQKAKNICPQLTFVSINEYKPGDSLNKGIEAATGQIIVCISAHCIPANDNWLEALCIELQDDEIAGVYGRQIPLESTEGRDARDLWITFGLDKRVQVKDPFFHNANSAFLKRTWIETPFNEKITNLEDRVWGKEQIKKGRKIIYTPDSVVFHHHGIHQNGNAKRCDGVVNVMKSLHSDDAEYINFFNPFKNQKSMLIVPVSRRYGLHDEKMFEKSIEKLKAESEYFDIYVLPDSNSVKKLAEENGFRAPYVREHSDNIEIPPLVTDLHELIAYTEAQGEYYDHVAIAEMIYPNRREKLFSDMLLQLRKIGADSIVAAWPEKRPVMVESASGLKERYDDFHHSLKSRRPVYIGVPGLGVISKPELIRNGKLFSETSAIFEINDWSEIEENRAVSSLNID